MKRPSALTRALTVMAAVLLVVATPGAGWAVDLGGDRTNNNGNGNGGVTRDADIVIAGIDWGTDGTDGSEGEDGKVVIRVKCDHCMTYLITNTCNYNDVTGLPCEGPEAGCEVGEQLWNVHWSAYAGPENGNDPLCRTPGEPPVPDVPGAVADLSEDLELLIPTLKAHPTNSVLPVGMKAYFEADQVDSYSSPAAARPGGTVRIVASEPQYRWDFGNGVTRTTTSNGGPHPDGDVFQQYNKSGVYTASLRMGWHVEAFFTIEGLDREFGPITTTPQYFQFTVGAEQAEVRVAQARSRLIG